MSKTEQTPFGFRILGECRGVRKLVDWLLAFIAYAACDPNAKVECEAYLSAFLFGSDFQLRNDGWQVNVRGFDGPCGGIWLWFDIDVEGDLERAQSYARRLCAGLVELYGIDGDLLLIFFSGAKGFHVGLPLSLCGSPPPSIVFHKVAKRLASAIADRLKVPIDIGVYDKVRAFRAPNSRHPKTGLYKRRLSYDELLGLKLDAVLRLADAPEPFDVQAEPPASEQAVEDWRRAGEAVEAEAKTLAERRAAIQAAGGAGATLNRATREFIRDGATQGDRHRLLFSAAANLAEFGCPPALAHELLTEPALDSGLPPSKIHRQIECGLKAQGGEK